MSCDVCRSQKGTRLSGVGWLVFERRAELILVANMGVQLCHREDMIPELDVGRFRGLCGSGTSIYLRYFIGSRVNKESAAAVIKRL